MSPEKKHRSREGTSYAAIVKACEMEGRNDSGDLIKMETKTSNQCENGVLGIIMQILTEIKTGKSDKTPPNHTQ